MAHEMGMLSGAKWVDSKDKIDSLKNLNIDYVQGYIAGRVLNEKELIELFNPINRKS